MNIHTIKKKIIRKQTVLIQKITFKQDLFVMKVYCSESA